MDKKRKKDNFKERYFEYYDDVKSHTHDVYDWWANLVCITMF